MSASQQRDYQAGTSGPAERLLRLGERLVSVVVETARTRAELFVVEFAVERVRLVQLLAMGVVFSVTALLALAFASMWAIVYFWDSYRLTTIAVITLIYAAIAAVAAFAVLRMVRLGPPAFANTLDTLQRDYAAVQERLRSNRATTSTELTDPTIPVDLS